MSHYPESGHRARPPDRRCQRPPSHPKHRKPPAARNPIPNADPSHQIPDLADKTPRSGNQPTAADSQSPPATEKAPTKRKSGRVIRSTRLRLTEPLRVSALRVTISARASLRLRRSSSPARTYQWRTCTKVDEPTVYQSLDWNAVPDTAKKKMRWRSSGSKSRRHRHRKLSR